MSRFPRLSGSVMLGLSLAIACGGVTRTSTSKNQNERDSGTFTPGAGGGRAATGGRFGAGGWPYSGDGSGPGTGAYPTSGGYPNTGGYPYDTGGKTGTGGAAGSPACSRPPLDPGGPSGLGSACCASSYGMLGQCISEGASPPPPLNGALGHDSCAGTLRCAPSSIFSEAGAPLGGAMCRTDAGLRSNLEGRCIAQCFTLGSRLQPDLRQGTCALYGTVCMPCYDPIDGSATSACRMVSWDYPVEPPPPPLGVCGGFDGGPQTGYCVPRDASVVSASPLVSQLRQDECPPSAVCVPRLNVEKPGACFERCTTTLASLGAQYGAGACVPSFFVRDQNPTGLAILTQGSCSSSGELCSPCLDPLNNGASTHLCE